MGAQLVLQNYLERFNTRCDTISDIAIDNLPFLIEQEPFYNMKGQKAYKSYFAINLKDSSKGKEAVKIVYSRIIGDYTYENITYNDIFLGISKKYQFFDWTGQVAYEKVKQPYLFNLEPVFINGGEGAISGFSSKKQREILREERYCADDYLQAKNPDLYAALYNRYTADYEYYLKTGKKDDLVAAMNAETDPDINQIFNKEVFGFEPLTVKQLIIMNLQ